MAAAAWRSDANGGTAGVSNLSAPLQDRFKQLADEILGGRL